MIQKIKYLIFIVLIPIVTFSQSIDRLDEKNGFKEIKLNKKISEYSDQVNYLGNNDYRFDFRGNKHSKVFDMKTSKLFLHVNEDQTIVKIIIFVQPDPDKKIGYLKENFEFLFGKPTAGNANEDKMSFIWYWQGEKTHLSLISEYINWKKGYKRSIIIGRVKDIKEGF